MHAGILTVGGEDGSRFLSTAEIFFPKSGHSCKIGNITVATGHLALCGNLVSGGQETRKSCSRFDGVQSFKALAVTLTEDREHHLCWELPSREVLLIGGIKSPRTTEKVSADGSSSTPSFNLPYNIEYNDKTEN